MAGLPENPTRELRAAKAVVARVGQQRPAGAEPKLPDRAKVVHRVMDQWALGVGGLGAGLDRAPGQVRVLAAVDATEGGDVESAHPLEELSRVEDVARLQPRVE